MQSPFTVTNHNPDTIFNRLASRLGREPTNAECREECYRIMREVMTDMAGRGKLAHQRC